jgi:hypothetical protein
MFNYISIDPWLIRNLLKISAENTGMNGKIMPAANINKKKPVFRRKRVFKRKATTYSPTCYGSTISADRFNFSVRDGKR